MTEVDLYVSEEAYGRAASFHQYYSIYIPNIWQWMH